MDVRLVIKQRLEQLGLEQRDLAAAVQVTESYISQLLTRKKAPPAADRTDLYERMNAFLKLPKGQLVAMVEAQRREELKKKLADPPAPLFKEVRELIMRKCKSERQGQVREIFQKQAFGELERLVTQKLLDVTKRVAKDELRNESWLRIVAKLRGRSYEEMRAIVLEFLDTDVFNISPDHCSAFLDPLIDSWDIDLRTFGMEIVLNRRLTSSQLMKFQFVEMEPDGSVEEEPGFQEFLRNPVMSGDATEEEIEFLKSLRFKQNRPSPLYYYRELQSLRDPLHFLEGSVALMHKRREAVDLERQLQLDSRKRAIRRWAKNRNSSKNKPKSKSPFGPGPGAIDIN
jgi:transcriptional regulator with XRE-family HTH domain